MLVPLQDQPSFGKRLLPALPCGQRLSSVTVPCPAEVPTTQLGHGVSLHGNQGLEKDAEVKQSPAPPQALTSPRSPRVTFPKWRVWSRVIIHLFLSFPLSANSLWSVLTECEQRAWD